MSDLHEMATERKRSDTSLVNFMQEHKVAVHYDGKSKRWIATTEDYMGKGKGIRSAIIDLERKAIADSWEARTVAASMFYDIDLPEGL